MQFYFSPWNVRWGGEIRRRDWKYTWTSTRATIPRLRDKRATRSVWIDFRSDNRFGEPGDEKLRKEHGKAVMSRYVNRSHDTAGPEAKLGFRATPRK